MTHKRIFITLVLSGLFITLTSFVLNGRHGSGNTTEEKCSDLPADSTVNVIAWFDNRDTMTYYIYDGEWSFDGEDTVKTIGAYTKVLLTVTDSTKHGYNMEYKFLEFHVDTAINTEKQKWMKLAADKLQERVTGTTIKFRINEVGEITKYDNLNEIKKQAKDVMAEVVRAIPYIDTLAAAGIKTERLLKLVDADALVDGYVEEVELLFQWHGRQFKTGEYTTHDDATDTEYESDTYLGVTYDPENYKYDIMVDVNNYIPKEDLNDILGVLADIFLEKEDADKAKKEMKSGIEEQIKDSVAVRNSFLYSKYFPDGWPEEIISQEKTVIGEKGKLSQKYITWDYRSVGNYQQ